jgi:glycosyltransferase involved in cell wall biosynthesis
VSDVLLVTQTTRSIGEFRRPWVRRLFARYAAHHRRLVARAVAACAAGDAVTVLGARELVDPALLPSGVRVRFYDDESFKVDDDVVARVTRHLTSGWWPRREDAPDLVYQGVWLPDLLSVQRGIVLRLEVAEPLATVLRLVDDVRPARLVLLTGASIPERLARAVARRDGLGVDIACARALWPRVYASVYGALFPREERLRLGTLLRFPRRAVPPLGPPRAERVLFVSCRPRHHVLIDPLVAALRGADHEAAVIAAAGDAPELARKLDALRTGGVAAATYVTDFLPARHARALARRHRPRLRALWRRLARGDDLARRLAWDGIELGPVARPFLADSVRTSLVTALLTQEASLRAVTALRPTVVVVTGNRRYPERAVAFAAARAGLPVLLFSGSLLAGRDPSHLFDIGDRLVVIGEHLRQRLVERGMDAARIAVVGDPRSNAARLVSRGRLRAEVALAFGLDVERPIAVLVSKYVSLHFSEDEKQALYRTVAGALELVGDLQVVVKVHPNENLALLRRQVRAWGWPAATLTQDYDIHRLFRAADLAMMVTSTAGVEAMAMGCPVIALQPSGKDFEGAGMPAYVTGGAVERVDLGDAPALAHAVKRLLDDADARGELVARARAFASRYVQPVDGRLVQRLIDAVHDVRRARGLGR